MYATALARPLLKRIGKLNQNFNAPLENLLRGFPLINVLGSLDREISGVVFDSREAKEGVLFVAIPGFKQDGSLYIKEALQRGARAYITSTPFEGLNAMGLSTKDATAICVEDCRAALAWVGREFYHRPANDLDLIGITGSNGKTTLTFILESVLAAAGEPTGVIGSIDYRYGGVSFPAPMTTPESVEIHRMLREMADIGVTHCFLEVSSHSLALKRALGLDFSVGVFTNFSRDHLDFHGSMEDYKNAKKSLFTEHDVKKSVINTDDPVGREFAAINSQNTTTLGIDLPADVMAEDLVLSDRGSEFTLKTPFGSHRLKSKLPGRHNVYNLLCGAATALSLGVPFDDVLQGLERVEQIPGRFERVDAGQDFTVAVDYAHTDDALKNILTAAREFCPNKIITVFGCGGDRDAGKRQAMGRWGVELSDFAVVTTDNPRSEDPEKIIAEICEGIPDPVKRSERYSVAVDRREAIERAINKAETGDLVLIAGKGHEDYQIFKDRVVDFDDRKVAEQILNARMRLD